MFAKADLGHLAHQQAPGPRLWGTLKNVVNRRKPVTLAALWEEIDVACAAIAEHTFANVARTVVQCTQKCADAHRGHFEQVS